MQGRMPNLPPSSTDTVTLPWQPTVVKWGANERTPGGTTLLACLVLGCLWGFAVIPATAEQYRYDDLGRLISTTLDDGATITYRYDAAGNRSSVTQVAGDPANDPPLAVNDMGSTNEDQSVVISPLANDSDPQGDSLTLAGIDAPFNGSAVISGNTVIYTPDLNYFGSDSFDYEVSDGSLLSAATISVNVTAVNDPPTASPDSISITEDVSHVFDPRSNDVDVESDWPALRIASATDGAKGSVSILSNDTRLRYTPDLDASGADSFTYTIRDQEDAVATGTVSVSIAAVNDPVSAMNDEFSTQEDTLITFDPRSNDIDPDGPQMTISDSTQGARGTVTILQNGTRLGYRPYANAFGADSFVYTVTDGLSSDTATVSMTIVPVNDPPIAVNDLYDEVTREEWVSLNVLANDYDPDGDALTIASVSQPLAGQARVADGGTRVEYIYDAPFLLDEDGFSYTISDSGGLLASASVSVAFESGIGFPVF